MSYDQADSKFPRLISPIDAARTAQGGLAVLGDENPNGATAADVDVADAALGAIGITPTGVLWKKIAMTTGTQWAPLAAPTAPNAFALGFQVTADDATATWTAPFDCEIVGYSTVGQAADNYGDFTIVAGGDTYTTTPIALDSAAGVPITEKGVINQAARDVAQGATIAVTYDANGGGSGGGATSPILWITVRPVTSLITN